MEANLLNQFYIKLSGEHVSGASRYQKLALGLQLFFERPLFGYQPGYFVSINGTQPGNVFLTILIEFGLIGAVSMFCYLVFLYKDVIRFEYMPGLVIQFIAFGAMNVSYNPIFYLPLIFFFYHARLKYEKLS